GTYLQGIALGADWLMDGRVDGCVVIGAEETDWLTADAMRLYSRNAVMSAGAGALYLRRDCPQKPAVRLKAITERAVFGENQSQAQAARSARAQLGPQRSGQCLYDGVQGVAHLDRAEALAWQDWTGPRISVKRILGEGLMAAAAWQCVAAVDALQQNKFRSAVVSVVGANEQAIAAEFETEPA